MVSLTQTLTLLFGSGIVVPDTGVLLNDSMSLFDPRPGGRTPLEQCRGRMPRLRRLWADGAYCGRLVRWARRAAIWVLEIVSRPPGSTGFLRLKWRWIVERTNGWLNLARRLSKDYEVLPVSSEVFIRLTMISIMLNRLAQ